MWIVGFQSRTNERCVRVHLSVYVDRRFPATDKRSLCPCAFFCACGSSVFRIDVSVCIFHRRRIIGFQPRKINRWVRVHLPVICESLYLIHESVCVVAFSRVWDSLALSHVPVLGVGCEASSNVCKASHLSRSPSSGIAITVNEILTIYRVLGPSAVVCSVGLLFAASFYCYCYLSVDSRLKRKKQESPPEKEYSANASLKNSTLKENNVYSMPTGSSSINRLGVACQGGIVEGYLVIHDGSDDHYITRLNG
ncbi:EML1_2 [Acanthosepion pharaonis]|uniref:EML1_2 n=1 Tax=Acanthosepion pharaonis TaxID=158019 RepID=A0A812EM70_ACAPH|nr:EML1_2 [Sepia pharaonis]